MSIRWNKHNSCMLPCGVSLRILNSSGLVWWILGGDEPLASGSISPDLSPAEGRQFALRATMEWFTKSTAEITELLEPEGR